MVSLNLSDNNFRPKEVGEKNEMKMEFSGNSNKAYNNEDDSDVKKMKKSYSTFEHSDKNRNSISVFLFRKENIITYFNF